MSSFPLLSREQRKKQINMGASHPLSRGMGIHPTSEAAGVAHKRVSAKTSKPQDTLDVENLTPSKLPRVSLGPFIRFYDVRPNYLWSIANLSYTR